MLVYIQKVLCWFTYKRQTQTECQKIHAEKEYWYQKKKHLAVWEVITVQNTFKEHLTVVEGEIILKLKMVEKIINETEIT